MKVLAVSTATRQTSIALVDDEKIFYVQRSDQTRQAGHDLILRVQQGMAAAGWTFSDLDLLAAVTGPGSFTGIRIGLAAVAGFALAAGRPAVGVSSFDLFRTQDPTAEGALNIVALHSGREELYFAVFEAETEEASLEANVTPVAFAALYGQTCDVRRPIVLSGDAGGEVTSLFPGSRLDNSPRDALDLARQALALQAEAKKKRVGNSLIPYYGRQPDVTFSSEKNKIKNN